MIRNLLGCACLLLVASVALADESGARPLSQDAFLALPTEGAEAPFVLDVRTPDEYASGYVPGAVNIPHDRLASRLAEVPRDRPVVLYCRSGRRAAVAAELLKANGYQDLEHLEGDMLAWTERGRPTERPKDAAACSAALKSGEADPASCKGD